MILYCVTLYFGNLFFSSQRSGPYFAAFSSLFCIHGQLISSTATVSLSLSTIVASILSAFTSALSVIIIIIIIIPTQKPPCAHASKTRSDRLKASGHLSFSAVAFQVLNTSRVGRKTTTEQEGRLFVALKGIAWCSFD